MKRLKRVRDGGYLDTTDMGRVAPVVPQAGSRRRRGQRRGAPASRSKQRKEAAPKRKKKEPASVQEIPDSDEDDSDLGSSDDDEDDEEANGNRGSGGGGEAGGSKGSKGKPEQKKARIEAPCSLLEQVTRRGCSRWTQRESSSQRSACREGGAARWCRHP